ncbi:hypothetical protein SAMN05421504_104594 [Amycolatopsis xylanica]|uniref:Uncharacterized protein n=2 Tax=Amycolatopsis xylanica TaxID=589385 RepID=A0A1H3HBE7_9PSEU|nr:hypothetical protein SAMN05421504_104594 [Amycolatopsis xylanica]
MTAASSVGGRLSVVNVTVPASLVHRRATEEEQATWTAWQRAVNTCMYCQTAYKAWSGAAYVCEHHHEGC